MSLVANYSSPVAEQSKVGRVRLAIGLEVECVRELGFNEPENKKKRGEG